MPRLAVLLLGAAALAAATLTAGAQEVTLRLHMMLPLQASVPAKVLAPWAEKIAADSGGRIKVELHPSMQLGGRPEELFDQAKDGVVETAWVAIGATPGRFPAAQTFELPFLPTTGEATSKAFHEFCQRRCAKEFEGVKVLAWHTQGPALIHSKNPITRIEDIDGLKIHGGSRAISQFLEKLGGRVVALPEPVVPEALAKGMIDAATMPWDMTPALKVTELVKNHTGFAGRQGLSTQTFALVMNAGVYERLPADLRQVIDANSGVALAGAMGRAMDEGDAAGRDAAKKLLNRIAELDETETQRWKDAAMPVIQAWEAEMTAQGIDGRQLLSEARALVEKNSAPPQ